ncbi:MAG: 4-hydroxythreonine-4-phosphate dehydrogenase PdxA [Planctomycetes bacterium]|nr:4-hydroxythreonine-4-phosphate dehydrogenase PdxA [Planctomycetota bacterium]
MNKKRNHTIGITMGDPCGVGPEVALKATAALKKSAEPIKIIIIGSRAVFAETAKIIGLEDLCRGRGLNIIDTGDFDIKNMSERKPTPEAGKAAVECILKGIEMARSGEIDALVTAPISKEAVRMAGYPYPGHTEMLAERTGAGNVVMMMVGKELRVSFVTIHVPLKEVFTLISTEKILSAIKITADGLERLFGIPRAKQRIAVCALNPHAGEGGLMGSEENEIIRPAVECAANAGINCSGPIASDVIFHRAARGEYDAVVSLYHDQGSIPIKLLAFESGVNLTLGLPIIRTSPTHGTAFEIAGRGLAHHGSMLEAIRLANRLAISSTSSSSSSTSSSSGATKSSDRGKEPMTASL